MWPIGQRMGTEMEFLPLVVAGRLRILDDGTVERRLRDGSYRAIRPSRRGYVLVAARIGGRRRTCYGHRLAWVHAHGPIPDGLEVNHLDGNKSNNDPRRNLELVTCAENIAHARHVLGHYVGTRNGNARLSEEDVRTIRRRALAGESLDSIAESYGVTRECARLIHAGLRWAHLLGADEGQVAA